MTEFVEYEQTLPLNSKLAHIRETAATKFAWPEVEVFDIESGESLDSDDALQRAVSSWQLRADAASLEHSYDATLARIGVLLRSPRAEHHFKGCHALWEMMFGDERSRPGTSVLKVRLLAKLQPRTPIHRPLRTSISSWQTCCWQPLTKLLADRAAPPAGAIAYFFPLSPRIFLTRSLAAAAFPPAESEASARSTTHQRRAPHASGASCATPQRARPPQRARYRANANCPSR